MKFIVFLGRIQVIGWNRCAPETGELETCPFEQTTSWSHWKGSQTVLPMYQPKLLWLCQKRQLQYGNHYHQYPLIFHTQTWQHGSLRSVLCMDKICIFIANHRIKGFRFRPWYVEYLISGKKKDACVPKIPSKKVPCIYFGLIRLQDWKNVRQLAAGDLFLG